MHFFYSTYPSQILRGFLKALFTIVISLFLSGCFTGIESTKKINLSREDRKNANPTPEELFMSQLEHYPLISWQQGKKFIVTDNRAMLVIVPQKGLLPVAPDSIKGKTLEYSGVESKINAAGNLTVGILFTDGVYIYSYDTGKEFEEAMQQVTSDKLPLLIDIDMVDGAKTLLTGKSFWTRSPLWYDADGNRIDGEKYVKVTVTDVSPGDMIFPLRLEIKTDEGKTAYVYMNYGSDNNESRSFGNLFSLNDIKKNYPHIEPEIWALISHGKVKVGMTKEECKLALGNPSDLNSGHDYSQTIDIWSYENGRVLWFEDGRLVKIRQ